MLMTFTLSGLYNEKKKATAAQKMLFCQPSHISPFSCEKSVQKTSVVETFEASPPQSPGVMWIRLLRGQAANVLNWACLFVCLFLKSCIDAVIWVCICSTISKRCILFYPPILGKQLALHLVTRLLEK